MILTANLDSVYKIGDKKVYELVKTGKSEHNMFVVIIEAYFHNGNQSRGITKPFLCVGHGNSKKEEEKIFFLPCKFIVKIFFNL